MNFANFKWVTDGKNLSVNKLKEISITNALLFCISKLYLVHFRWGSKELMKAARPLLKKLGGVMGSPPSATRPKYESAINLTMARMHFNRRKKIPSSTDSLGKDQLNFYKSLSPSSNSESQVHVDCPVCCAERNEQVLLDFILLHLLVSTK